MASCRGKYNDNEDSLDLLQYNPLKSSFDTHQSTNNSVHSINEYSTKLFDIEMKDIDKGINSDISSQHSTDGRDSDIGLSFDFYDNDDDDNSYNPQRQLSTAVSKVQIKLNNLINNHKATLKLHNDIV